MTRLIVLLYRIDKVGLVDWFIVSKSHELTQMCVIVISSSGHQIYGGPGSLSMISKYGPSLSKALGPVDPSFLVVKISHFNKKNIHLTVSLQ